MRRAILLFLALAACSKSESTPVEASAAPVGPASKLEKEPRTVTTRGANVTTVRLRIPNQWNQRGTAFFGNLGKQIVAPGLTVGAGCLGECTKENVEKALTDYASKVRDQDAKGTAAGQGPLLDVTTLEEGSLPNGGAYVANKILLPADPNYNGKDMPRYHASCAIPVRGRGIVAWVDATAPIEVGQENFKILIESCKSLSPES